MELGKEAYEAYEKKYADEGIIPWEKLSARERVRWGEAAHAVAVCLNGGTQLVLPEGWPAWVAAQEAVDQAETAFFHAQARTPSPGDAYLDRCKAALVYVKECAVEVWDAMETEAD